ncbi:hypothetical protein OS493_036407 [Desmophyllum pertusum]|uniref:Uncharacterized protein n=1 Tax=Desmophyllum pertusum TaxID=174260 RepID=A0A9W9ZK58_9CNID|nr:hypothetical protein OS493_036407 [Desmophyllum pertusum]
MNNDFLQDCGILVDDEGLRNELNDVQRNYFSTDNRRNMGELSAGHSSSDEQSEVEVEGSAEATGSSQEEDFNVSVKTFQESDCGCSHGKNRKPCSKSLRFQDVTEHRMQCVELTSAELDLVIMGAIQSQTKSDFEWQILKDVSNKPPAQLPPIISPAGLDAARKQYLFREIRPFCRPGTEEHVAPNPDDRSDTGVNQ